MTLKNTKENATIELVSRQSSGELSNKIEFISDGGYYERDGKTYITYREHRDMGMGDSRVVLKIDGNTVTMRRMGEFQTVMVYKNGEVTDFNYRVPFGEMSIKIRTQRIENCLGSEGGNLAIDYLLFVGSEVTKNEILIKVKMNYSGETEE